MALGLLGARGERHVHRRRSACDRLHSCGVWPGPRRGGGGDRAWAEETVVRSALAARRGRDDCLKALPPLPPPQPSSCASQGRAPFRGVPAVGGEGLTPCSLICLSPCKVYLRKAAVPACKPTGRPWGSLGWVPRTGWGSEGTTAGSVGYLEKKKQQQHKVFRGWIE